MGVEIKMRVNHEIKGLHKIRLVGEGLSGEITTMSEAIKIAKETNLDLLEINKNSDPPVIKLLNYDKFIYERKKSENKNKKQNKVIKEIRFGVNIATNDLNVKMNHIINFLKNGHKVKVVLQMKGRELSRKEEYKKIILQLILALEEYSNPETLPKEELKTFSVILKPKK